MEDENDPERPTIWKEARNHVEKAEYDRAIEIYKYLLIRFGENSIVFERANANLGDIYLTLKQPDQAESYIKKAIKRNPKKPEYHYLLGFVYSPQNRWAEAIHEFETAIESDPDNAEYLRGLGWAQFNGGDKIEGFESLMKAKEIDPLNVNILLDLANAYLFEMDFEEAKRYAKGAIYLKPGDAVAKKLFDKICQVQKDYGKDKG